MDIVLGCVVRDDERGQASDMLRGLLAVSGKENPVGDADVGHEQIDFLRGVQAFDDFRVLVGDCLAAQFHRLVSPNCHSESLAVRSGSRVKSSTSAFEVRVMSLRMTQKIILSTINISGTESLSWGTGDE